MARCRTGVDIAYCQNGYVYHTKYDDVHRFEIGSMFRSGQNLHALIAGILRADEFADPGKKMCKHDSLSKLVTFCVCC